MENISKLKQVRLAHKMTQVDCAKACELNERQYQRYENGEQEPTVSVAIKIAKVFDCTVEELF